MSSKEHHIIIPIKDDLGKKTGLTAKWVSGDKMSVFAHKRVKYSTKDRPSELSDQYPVNIIHFDKPFVFDEPILRSLIGEANGIFLSVQKIKENGSSRSEYLKISRTYRSTIRARLEKLQEKLNEREDESVVDEYQNYITILYTIECIWHLCEIMYVDPSPTNVIVPQLLEWIRFHFPSHARIAAEYLQFEREASSNPEFWNVVKGLILQGNIQIGRALLRLHPGYESIAFQSADQILQSLPLFTTYSGLSVQKFKSQWQYWVNDAESRISAGALSTEPELERIIKLICGNSTAWSHEAKKSSCWYEIFPGFIFYTDPCCKHFELGSFANDWLGRWLKLQDKSNASGMRFLDKVILSVMENDMNQVLHDIQNLPDNQWFVVHLTDLLYNCGQIKIVDENQIDVTENLRESLLFDFGSALMGRDTLWTFGIDYLEHSSEEGIAAIELFLSKVPFKNEKYAMQILAIARQKKMVNLESEICRVLTIKALSNQRYGNALEWALRSQNYTLVTSCTNILLKHYCKTGELICEDLLSNIGPKMMVSARLVFLVKYHDFYQLFKEKEYGQASTLLVNMLDSQLTPEYFWPSLLADTLTLLERDEQIISSKGTYVIMHYIEQKLLPLIERGKRREETLRNDEPLTKQFQNTLYLSDRDNAYFFNDTRIENVEVLARLLKLACARNLGKSLIYENTNFSHLNN